MRWGGIIIILFILFSCGSDEESPGPLATGLDVTSLNPGTTLSGDKEMMTYDPSAGSTFTLEFDETMMEFDIPVDQLDTTQLVTLGVERISALSNLPDDVSSVVALRFEPDGFSFFEPVTVTVDLEGDYDFDQLAAYRISNGEFRFIPMVRNTDGTLTFLIDHFSDYGVLSGVDEIKAIESPVTADDYLNNLAAAHKKARELIGDIFNDFYNNILRPRIEIEKELDLLVEDIKAELRFLANKQMLGVDSRESDFDGIHKMFRSGIKKLDSACKAADCRWNYPPLVLRWIVYSQHLGLEADEFQYEGFCGGKLLEIINNLEFEQPGPIEIVLGQPTEIGIDLFADNPLTGQYEQLGRGYDQVVVSTTKPDILSAEIEQVENDGGPTEIVSHITATGLELGTATIIISEPCDYVSKRLIVTVVEQPPQTGTATITCTETTTSTLGAVDTVDKEWEVTIEASTEFNTPSGQYIISNSTISGSGFIQREYCFQGCTIATDSFEFNQAGQTGTGNADYLAKFYIGNVFGVPTTFYLEGDIVEGEIQNAQLYQTLHVVCTTAPVSFQ